MFVLGPSHHVYLDGCALSTCSDYTTPLGPLTLDHESKLTELARILLVANPLTAIKELRDTGKFLEMALDVDQDEHRFATPLYLPLLRPFG